MEYRFDSADIEKNKGMAILGNFGALFFIPLVAAPDSAFARFHANQGLNILLLIVASTIIMIIPILGWILGAIAYVFALVCCIMGIINASKGVAKPLPLIGKISIIKPK